VSSETTSESTIDLSITGESRIGDAPDTTITTAEWNVIEGVCFGGVNTLTLREHNLITAFGIISYLLMSIVVISKIIFSALDNGDGTQKWLVECRTIFSGNTVSYHARLCIEAVVAITLIIQFWAFFRLRQLQSNMTQAAGGSFPDGQWTFGQIVATVVFIPVAAELMFVWKKRSLYLR
jgi:predicted small integral membrane protein